MVATFLAVSLLAPKAHLHFVIYGDTRDGHEDHRKIVAAILAAKPELVVNTGDLVKRGTDASLWAIFDDITGKLRASTDYYAVRGNHDFGDALFEKRFKAPVKERHGAEFAFDRGGCHFIGLCLDEHTAYDAGSDQYDWLVADLEKSKGKFAHTFVMFHVPPYSIGTHGPNPDEQKVLGPVFSKYQVDAVFNGHDHNYYRTFRDGVNYIVAGGGGAPLYPCDPEKGVIAGDKYESVHSWVDVHVDGDKVSINAIREDGSSIEATTLKTGALVGAEK